MKLSQESASTRALCGNIGGRLVPPAGDGVRRDLVPLVSQLSAPAVSSRGTTTCDVLYEAYDLCAVLIQRQRTATCGGTVAPQTSTRMQATKEAACSA